MQELIFLLFMAGIFLYWWDTTKTNEIAFIRVKVMCNSAHLQLLDGTVMRQKVWLRYVAGAGMQVCRLYSFEYSDDRESRYFGYAVLVGHTVEVIQLDTQHFNS